MTPFVPLFLFGWIPLVLYLFNRFPPQRAIIISFVVGFLFLPQVAKYPIVSGIPPYDKMSAISYSVLLATIIFVPERFNSFKPGWLDLPMLIWSLCPIAAQLNNERSPISPTTLQIITWGVPYFLGRIYLTDLAGLRQLAVGIFAGGIIYAPLCLLETRIAPTLHLRLYGFHARQDFTQTIRFGGYRPTVFLEHGLWVGMWMMAATFIGIVLWRSGALKKLWGIPITRLVIGLFIVFLLVKSTGAYLYLAIGLGCLFIGMWLRTALPVLVLVIALSTYLYMGATGTLYTTPQVSSFLFASENSNNDRSQSLAFRIANEKLLSEKAKIQMMFGWGDSGKNRIYDEEGRDISVTDSLWIIAYGNQGIVGLISFTCALFVPSLGFCFLRYPPSTWSNRKVAPAVGLALLLILYMLDSALNAMTCPVFLLASGGLSTVSMQPQETDKTTTSRSSAPQRSLERQTSTASKFI